MAASFSRLAQSRARARRHLAALKHAAALGGLSLAALGATATPASAPTPAPPESPSPRPLPSPTLAPGDVRPATAAERAALSAVPVFAAGVTNAFGLIGSGTYSTPSVGDLDGDGDLDVLAGTFNGDFRYFENTAGAGATPAFAAVATNPFGLVSLGGASTPTMADLDGDGDLDVLAGDFTSTLRYLENTAGPGVTPAFAAAVTNPFGLTGSGIYSTPSVGDLDGDGDLDVLAGESGGTFRYFENTAGPGATPAFLAAVTDPFGLVDVGTYSAPSLGDLDGDGDLDVLAGEFGGTFRYAENTAGAGATPAFAAAVTDPFGLADVGAFSTPSMGDLDGDGDLDVLSGVNNGSFRSFENTQAPPPGAGRGTEPAFAAVQADPFGLADVGDISAPSVADLDGDGDLDVLAGEKYGTFRYFENTAGAGATPAFLAAVTDPFGLADVGHSNAPSVGDLDGDGDLDVLAGAFPGTFRYFENTGSALAPAFTERTGAANPLDGVDVGTRSRPSVGDLDGDGDLDVLAGEDGGTFRYFENTAGAGATPAFAAPVTDPFGLADVGFNSAPSVGDLDGDGDLDVLAGRANGNFRYFENTAGAGATPAFLAAATDPFGLANVGIWSAPSVGDLDGDGDLDVLAGEFDGAFHYFENTAGTAPLAVQLTGAAGFRFLGSPNPSATLADLLDDPLWIQGATTGGDTDAGTANVYRWNEATQDYDAVTDLSAAVGTAGVVVYVFSDDDFTTAGDAGFPKVLDVPGPASVPAGSQATFDVAGGNLDLSYTTGADPTLDGFNLIAAPSASWFSWAGVDLTDVNATVYVYDPAVSNYRTYTQGIGEGTPGVGGGVVGAFQAMYVQAQAATASLGITPAVTNGGPFSGRTATPTVVGLSLRPDAGSALPAALEGGVTLAFGIEGASDGYGAEDAIALAPPGTPALSAWTEAAGPEGSVVALAVDLRPDPTGEVEVPVVITAAGALPGEPLVLSWPRFDGIPADWSVRLVDRATGAEVDLRTETAYRFTASDGDVSDATARVDPLVPAPLAVPTRPANARTDGSRFALVVTPAGAVATEDGTRVDGVSLVRPNPTSGRAEVVVTLAEAGPLRAVVVDALGREVAVLHEGSASGTLRLGLDAGRLATGVYVVRVTGATLTESQTLTVVR